jgi:hypothetical protein
LAANGQKKKLGYVIRYRNGGYYRQGSMLPTAHKANATWFDTSVQAAEVADNRGVTIEFIEVKE